VGRTWRKNSEYGDKHDSKDRQRQLRKESEKIQKNSQKAGKVDQAEAFWDAVKRQQEGKR